MAELSRQSRATGSVDHHLARAEEFTRPLLVEEATLGGPNAEAMIRADQGQALRRVLYHCTAAIVAAIAEARHG